MINETDLEAFEYYNQLELPLEDSKDYDPRDKTPFQMVMEYAQVSGQAPEPKLYETLIHEEFFEWSEAEEFAPLNSEGAEACLKELTDLVYVCYGYANANGWDLDMALLRVHDNNMGRMYQPDGSIKRREDGKIIKNKDYPKVNLEDLV